MTLVYTLIVIFVMAILLLAIPVHIDYLYDSQAERRSRIHIMWLFGLVRISPESSAKQQEAATRSSGPAAKARKKKGKRGKKKKRPGKAMLAAVTSAGFMRRVFRLLCRLVGVAKIRQLQANVRFGLDDPADTGRLYGVLAPFFAMLYAMPRVEFAATPLFDRVGVEGHIHALIRLVPINYIMPMVLFISSRESLRTAKAVMKAYSA